jgi:hypothetical protein
MGTVYEAIDHERDTKVALKTLSLANASAAVWLKREFRAVADMAHDNLAPVYELGSDRGIWFFTMELVHGDTLTDWARDDAILDIGRNLPLSRTLSETVTGMPLDAHDLPRDRAWGEYARPPENPRRMAGGAPPRAGRLPAEAQPHV